MTALIVEVVDSASGKRSEYMFSKSPIRIGRSPLNELPLDHPFVSHCHGVIDFDNLQSHFVDLGSTNGTYVREQRLAPNERVALLHGTEIVMGTLVLTAHHSRAHAEDARGTYAFRRPDFLASPSGHVTPARPTEVSGVRSAGQVSEATFMAALDRAIPGVLQQGMESRVADRLADSLLRFAGAFLELQQGQHQLARDLSLPETRSDFGKGHSAMELVSLVVDPRTPGSPLDELSRAHADLMLHQVALINGARAGARAILAELAPDALAPRRPGILERLGRILGGGARLDALRRRHEELAEETALSSVLFGKAFRRAYAATLGQTESLPALEAKDKP